MTPAKSQNVIAELPGSREDAGVLYLGAHHDTQADSVGADDNASLLERFQMLADGGLGQGQAGDQFAAGFLYGLTRGDAPEVCARIGGIAAADVIGYVGARPRQSLRDLVARKLPEAAE